MVFHGFSWFIMLFYGFLFIVFHSPRKCQKFLDNTRKSRKCNKIQKMLKIPIKCYKIQKMQNIPRSCQKIQKIVSKIQKMYPIYHLQYMYSTFTVYYTRPERGRREGRRRKCKRLTILPITKYSLILNLFLIFSLCLNLSTVLYPHL